MKLTDVSKTSIATSLRTHVIESENKNPIINDPMAKYCLNKLRDLASEDEKKLLFDRKISPILVNSIAIRARKYDSITNDFIKKNPGCTVVNLGCGFDTRYWRINHDKCKYFDLDLPELIEIKKEILKDKLEYEMIGCSVLDTSWIEKVITKDNKNFLFLAEGLFMYLPKEQVINFFKTMSEKFEQSQISLDLVNEKYTRGWRKQMVIMKLKNEFGYDAGSSFNFGVKNSREIEGYAKGIKIIDDWSYSEDPDIRPKILKYFVPSKSQWTSNIAIN